MAGPNDVFSDQTERGSNNERNGSSTRDEFYYLKHISDMLEAMMKDSRKFSQSDARTYTGTGSSFKQAYESYTSRNKSGFRGGRSFSSRAGGFVDSFEESLVESILGKDYKKVLGQSVQKFADSFGLDLEHIEEQLGRELGNQVVDFIKKTKLGKSAYSKIDKVKNRAVNEVTDLFKQGVGKYDSKHGTDFLSKFIKAFGKGGSSASSGASASGSAASAASAASGAAEAASGAAEGAAAAEMAAAGEGAAGLAAASEGAGAAIAGLSSVAAAAVPWVLAIVVALKILKPALEGAKKLFDSLKRSAFRYKETEEKRTEYAKKRLESDVKTIIEAPFKILEEAAQNVYNIWDSNLRKITATQGYNKEDLQSLMSSFAQRLREDNLSDVISSTDITQSLTQVLDAGLSGPVAEEFAYIAAKLNAAVPTQDFFQYAGVYSSIASNAIRAGKSQSEALSYANEQLYSFASNVLYASRNIAGGFTTGLRDAVSLFEQSARIASASKTGTPAAIGGVLTTVAAVVGAMAPDLASSLTDAVYRAAVGGNQSDIVALRSLANINASNTEFLKKLAQDPQGVFSRIFENLAKMQGMAPDAWMEVAEGLSSTFGISMDALARVDFNYLANAISQMNLNNASLDENMSLLASGQTTLTQEQLKTRQINKYIIEEGLSYVLDNEAARAVQEHMWEEQLLQQVLESEYGVNIQGAALELLQGLRRTVDNIMNFLNPLGFMSRLVINTVKSVQEGKNQQKDIRQILELGRVGSGNATSLYQLLTRGTDLKLTQQLADMLGGRSNYQVSSSYKSGLYGVEALLTQMMSYPLDRIQYNTGLKRKADSYRAKLSSPSSKYSWGIFSKSGSLSSSGKSMSFANVSSLLAQNTSKEAQEEAAKEALARKFNKMLDESYLRSYAESGDLTYEDWKASAKNFGISDFNKAMEAAGRSEEEIKGYFNQAATEAASREARRREKKEEELWDATLLHQPALEGLVGETNSLITETNSILEATNLKLVAILDTEKLFLTTWVDYFINHKYYDASGYDYSKVVEIQKKEKKEKDSAIYALAEALSQNTVDLRDPAVQTNALLSQILVVVNAIMQQNNTPGSSALLGSLAALAMGGDADSINAVTSVT